MYGFKQNKVKLSALSPVTLMSWVWTHPQEPKGASLSWPNLLLQVETDLLQWQGLWSAAKAPTDVSMGKSPMRIHDKYWIASPLRSHNEAVYHGAQGEMINGDLGNLELHHWVWQVYELKALTSLQIQARRKCEIALLFGPLLCHLPAPLQLNPISRWIQNTNASWEISEWTMFFPASFFHICTSSVKWGAEI